MKKTWTVTLKQLILSNLMFLQQNAKHTNERLLYQNDTLKFLTLFAVDEHVICECYQSLDIAS